MKFTAQQAIEALRAVGVPTAEIVEKPEDATYNQDDFLTQVDGNREPVIKTRIEESITEHVAGKQGGLLMETLKKTLGVPADTFVGCKTDKERIEKAAKWHAESISKEKEDFNQQLKDLTDRLTEEHTTALQAKDEELRLSNDKYTQRSMVEYYEGKLATAPIPKNADKKYLAEVLVNHFRNLHDLEYSEAEKKINYMQKGKKLPALNATGNNSFSDDEEIKNILTKTGVWQTDMRNQNPAKAMDGQDTPPKKQLAPSTLDGLNAAINNHLQPQL